MTTATFSATIVAPPRMGTQIPKPRPAYVSNVVGTLQQEEFWRCITNEKGHIVLMARAGTGKTFSVIEAAKRALHRWPNIRVGFSAFNAHIAKELKGKVPNGCNAFTLHSLGLQAITRELGRKPNIEAGKVRAMLDSMAEPSDLNRGKVDRALVKAVSGLVALCKAYLYDGTPEQLNELVKRHDVDLSPDSAPPQKDGKPRSVFTNATLKPRVFHLVPFILESCKRSIGIIDYDDMIWLPVVLNLAVDTYDLLFIDEAQDMNKCQQKLAFKACPKGRIVIVGDPAQSIYAFRGADVQSMPNMTALLAESERDCKTLPLTSTRRCPKSVVNLAKQLVPDIEALPDAPEGSVEYMADKDFHLTAKAGDMVLCRCNAPLVKAAHQFLRAGKKTSLKGKDISGQIRDLIEGLGAQTIEELGDLLMRYRLAEGERLESAGKSAQEITAHDDRCDTLEVLTEGCRTLTELDIKISSIFDKKEEPDSIVLSSVHGSKGLEAQTVFILRPDLLPHPKAERAEDREQENNIKYVALTRSMNRLVFVVDEKEKQPAVDRLMASVSDVFDKHHGDSGELEPDDFDEDELYDFGDDLPDERLASKLETDTTVYADGEDPMCTVGSDWKTVARREISRLYDLAPFDAPVAYFDALEVARNALDSGAK